MLSACSNNLDEAVLEEQGGQENVTEVKPYISPQMEAILAKIENATEPIPIEEICSFINGSPELFLKEESEENIQTRGLSLVELRRTDGYSIISSEVQVKFSETQVMNWRMVLDIPSGYVNSTTTYYLTIGAASIDLIYSGGYQILKPADFGKYIGMDPDDSSQIGYHINELISGTFFRLTTYVYGFKIGKGDNYLYSFIPTNIISLGNPSSYLAWRFYEYN